LLDSQNLNQFRTRPAGRHAGHSPPKTPTLFLTKNKGLVHQNWKEMKEWGVENLGRWYGGYKEPNYVMCGTVHKATFDSLDKLLPKFKAIIVDEVHDCMSAVPLKAYKKMNKAIYRIGISATPFKYNKKKVDDCHKWLVKGHFGPIFKTSTTASGDITTKELQDRGILSSSDCYFYPIKLPQLIHEPYQDAVKLGIEQNFHFHDIVSRLAKSCPGRTLIVVERIEQGEYLKSLIPGANFIQGDTKLKDREPILNSMLAGDKSVAIVMRQIITAGINIKIHDLINAAGGDAAHNMIQLLGRGLRTANDKTKLKYHDFLFLINDYLRKHSEWRMEVIKTEGHSLTVKDTIDF
jgi:superfamily II DNA or RNA helicase